MVGQVLLLGSLLSGWEGMNITPIKKPVFVELFSSIELVKKEVNENKEKIIMYENQGSWERTS